MMKSMTGYGASRIDSDLIKANIVMKSWNNRFLELNLQMPSYFVALDRQIRELVESKIGRGKIDLSIRVSLCDMPVSVSADIASASSVAQAIMEIKEAAHISEDIKLSHILNIDGMLSFERNIDTEALWAVLEPALKECIDAFDKERIREGHNTKIDLENKLDILEKAVNEIEKVCPEIEENIKITLKERFTEVMGNVVDETRILSEIASFLAKHTINEEIIRLHSHISAFRKAMDEYCSGKKLDFICQEMNRESNTIGSKSADLRISDAIIRMKDAIENIREQARNIE